jgi:glutaredoxin-like protein
MTNSNIVVYGTNWCWDCTRARKLLKRLQVEYEWINIDKDQLGEQFVLETNDGMRSVPTIVFPDGSIMVEPSSQQLEDKLKIFQSKTSG